MSRFRGPRLKVIRRFQQHLPGLSRKTAERRAHPPGQHGQSRRTKRSDYRIRLEEKQKLRYNYGLSERQLRNCFKAVNVRTTPVWHCSVRWNLVWITSFSVLIGTDHSCGTPASGSRHVMVNEARLISQVSGSDWADCINSRKEPKHSSSC